MGGGKGKDNIDMEEWYEWCVIGRGLPAQSIWISEKCLLGGGGGRPRLASRKANSSGNFLPSPGSVAITVCVGDFQWGNSVIGVAALTGGMMRPEVEVAPEEVLWDRGVATAYRWVRKTNHSLPYNSTIPCNICVCHTLVEENQCPPP